MNYYTSLKLMLPKTNKTVPSTPRICDIVDQTIQIA